MGDDSKLNEVINMPELSRRNFLIVSAGATAAGIVACKNDKEGKVKKKIDNSKVKTSKVDTDKKTVPQNKKPDTKNKKSDIPLDTFGISESLVKKVMNKAMAKGGDYCDLYLQRRRFVWLGLEDRAVNKAYTTVEMGMGIRVLKDGQTGYAFSESFEEKSLLNAAEIASTVASGAKTKIPKSFNGTKHKKYYPVKSVWADVNPSKKVNLLTNIENRIRTKDKRIKNVTLSYADEESSILIIDSLGRWSKDFLPMTSVRINCIAEDKGRREQNYYNAAARQGLDFYSEKKLEQIASETVKRTTVLFKSVPGPVGEMPVVLSPGSSGILLHEAIGHGMEADFAKNKRTIYTDMVGKKIAPEFVTIVDDGTINNLRGSINMDDEGNNSQKTVLVEKGIFKTFMHDHLSSQHFKVKPTGNGRRESFKHMPVPRMRNTYMLNGPHDPKEIIKSVKKGIYAETFTNGQVAIGAGDFTFYIKTGFLIENGKLSAPIKDVNIIGNGPKVLKDVTMVGNDFKLDDGGWTCGKRGQGVPVGLGMPTVKVKSITVGGTSKKG